MQWRPWASARPPFPHRPPPLPAYAARREWLQQRGKRRKSRPPPPPPPRPSPRPASRCSGPRRRGKGRRQAVVAAAVAVCGPGRVGSAGPAPSPPPPPPPPPPRLPLLRGGRGHRQGRRGTRTRASSRCPVRGLFGGLSHFSITHLLLVFGAWAVWGSLSLSMIFRVCLPRAPTQSNPTPSKSYTRSHTPPPIQPPPPPPKTNCRHQGMTCFAYSTQLPS